MYFINSEAETTLYGGDIKEVSQKKQIWLRLQNDGKTLANKKWISS